MLAWNGLAVAGPFGPASIVFPLIGLPLLLATLYVLFGRFIYKARKRARTTYGVTDRRILRVLRGPRGDEVAAVFLSSIPLVGSTATADGVGTVSFGNNGPWTWLYANTGLDVLGWGSGSAPITFFDVHGAARVADLVARLRVELEPAAGR